MWFQWREESQESNSMELSATELDYLYVVIAAKQPLRLGAIAEQMRVSRASASIMVQKLQQRGYLKKTPDPSDARSVCVTPTDKCRALEVEEKSIYTETARRISDALTATELEELDRLLKKARSNLECS
jgi:DNA-binding MarR family transcriptional regulator